MAVDQQFIIGAMKAAAWERAKGELRVVAALEGSYAGYNPGRSDDDRYEVLKVRIEDFIRSIEEHGLHE